ncbi:cellulose synthase-like protein B4 [Cryptomeria japonica]|uniref:cellulose synthase-like protein B4 n=1 Tax=Cryptomeria japonica TaxID=3369 RepID=UPI0027DA55BF|nr:cellulose synthase-like protein B4 [Cryptomeria japonica]
METNACSSGPLFEKIIKKSNLYRAYVCLHFLLLLCFLSYRLLNPFHESFGLWIVAFTCELWFAFMWTLLHNMAWKFVEYKTYPERLAERYSGESVSKLPAVDVIITTTDPFKEPALITANEVLSVLALDYPVEKFACYISDDGSSPITFYSLVETLSFARKWVPFCRKFKLQTRAPFMYFSKEKESSS